MPTFTPRWEGLYMSAPTCVPGKDWERTSLRFFSDGRAAYVDGNDTPMDAARIITTLVVPSSPAPCTVTGAAVRCELTNPYDDEARDVLEGRGDGEWIDFTYTRSDGTTSRHSARFVPLDKNTLVDLDKERDR